MDYNVSSIMVDSNLLKHFHHASAESVERFNMQIYSAAFIKENI